MNIHIQLQMDGTMIYNSLDKILNRERIVFYRKSNFCRILIDKILKSLVFNLKKLDLIDMINTIVLDITAKIECQFVQWLFNLLSDLLVQINMILKLHAALKE